jgi:hypothetical protein
MDHEIKEFNAHRGKAWVAKITGPHPKYKLNREFVNGRRDVSTAKTNVYRKIEIPVPLIDGTVYEWGCQASSSRYERGFWRVNDSQLVEISYEEVIKEVIQDA